MFTFGGLETTTGLPNCLFFFKILRPEIENIKINWVDFTCQVNVFHYFKFLVAISNFKKPSWQLLSPRDKLAMALEKVT